MSAQSITNAQNAVNNAQNQLNSIQSQINNLQSELINSQNNLSSAQISLSDQCDDVEREQRELSAAEDMQVNALNDLENAFIGLATAEALLAGAIVSANPIGIAAAVAAVVTAAQVLETAGVFLQEAESAVRAETAELNLAEARKEIAQTEFDDAQAEFDTIQDDLSDAQDDLSDAQDDLSDAQDDLSDAQANCPEDPGTAEGDPHLTTFDGLNYDFQAEGEFTFVESIEGDYEVQIITEKGLSSNFPNGSHITEVAVRSNDTIISFDSKGSQPKYNGNILERENEDNLTIGDLSLLSDVDGDFVLNFNTGERLVIDLQERSNGGFNFFNLVFTPSQTEIVGLLGNNNSDPEDDLALRNGTILDIDTSTRELQGDYADSWRVTGDNSLFSSSDLRSTDSLQIGTQSLQESIDYDPFENDGLFFKREGDQLKLEFNGEDNGSRFRGRLIFDSPITTLNEYGIENSDSIELNENNQVLEFDLRVLNQWTDSFGFSFSENSSFSLQIDNGPININSLVEGNHQIYRTSFINVN